VLESRQEMLEWLVFVDKVAPGHNIVFVALVLADGEMLHFGNHVRRCQR
jgi:hypothetical protein